MRRFILFVIVLTFTVSIVGPILRGHGQDPAKKPEAGKAPAARPASEMDKLMQKKLQRAQRLLEGISVNDPDLIKDNARELLTLSKTAEFRVLKTPQYDLHSNEFRRSLEDVVKGAQARNIDSATLAYMDMVLACVRCHKHVREVRVTALPSPHESPTNLGGE